MLLYTSSILCAVVAAATILRGRRSLASWLFVAGMGCLGVGSLCDGISVGTVISADILQWQVLSSLAKSLLPGLWLSFSLTYARGNYREFLTRWRFGIAAAVLIPFALVVGFQDDLFTAVRFGQSNIAPSIGLAAPGKALNIVFLISFVLILMNLERTFRAAVGTMRWRIKFVVLGLAILFGTRIYTCSQAILYSAITPYLLTVDVLAVFVASVLIGISLLRSNPFSVELYPSRKVLQQSFTVILVGVYLVLVGVFARLVTVFGGAWAFPIVALVILVAVVLLGLVFLSDRVRLTTRRFISRHFRRPQYDYRLVWSSFTEKTASVVDQSALCQAVVRWTAETLNLLTATIWLLDQDRSRFVFGGSTSLTGKRAQELSRERSEIADVKVAAEKRPFPFDMDLSRDKWVEPLKQLNPSMFPNGGHRVCAPLVAGTEMVGLLVVGDRVRGVPFSIEDLELIKCIADQSAGAIQNLRLSQKLVQAKEMEAFQAMSTFFVHDLKNTASTLSLMLQNLKTHFENPAFREDALRAVSKSLKRINDLVGSLGLLRQKIEMKPVEADLNEVVLSTLKTFQSGAELPLETKLSDLPRISLDPSQIQKVMTNLLLNARDAIGPDGKIYIQTECRNGWVVLTVQDNGCGMSPEFVHRSLFRPFQTTKKQGIGIGMYHCKMIVDAHHGKIDVDSEPAKGTTFRILLPCE